MTEKELNELKQLETQGFFTCFRTGVWEDSEGKKHNITQGDLDTITQKFETRGTVIPLQISHFGKIVEGKVEKIIRYGDYLLAKAREVTENLKEKIQNGVKRFVSIAFNKDMELDHIAVTNEPQVDGLLPLTPAIANFSKEAIIFHFSKPIINQLEIKEDKNMPDEDKEKKGEVKEKTGSPPGNNNLAEFAAVQEKLTAAEKEKADALKAAAEANQKLAEFARQKKQEGISTFTAQLVKEGKLFPNEVDPMNTFLGQLDGEKLHQFSKDTSKSQSQFMKDFLSGLNQRIPLDKIDTGKKTAGTKNACFSRITPDEEDLSLHVAAKALAEKENISYLAALARVDGERR
jgi:hypothetical protein